MKLSFSLRNFEESTAATRTLSAPNGVTSAAGANAYARRLAASPMPTNRNVSLVKVHFNSILKVTQSL